MATDQGSGSSFLRRLGRTLTGKSLSIFSSKSPSKDSRDSNNSNILGSSHAAKPIEPSSKPVVDKNLSASKSHAYDHLEYGSFATGTNQSSPRGISSPRPSGSNQANLTPPPAYSRSFSPVTESDHPNTNDTTEPTSLALKIQSLFSNSLRSSSQPPSPTRNPNGRPVRPSETNLISDTNLIAMLQNATVMNGGSTSDKRMSVFSVLETLGESSLHGFEEGNLREGSMGHSGSSLAGQGQGQEIEEPEIEEVSGIMMYSPLMPTNLSLVEIAESGVFSSPEGEEKPPHSQQNVDPNSEPAQVAGWMGMWPFTSFWRNDPAVGATATNPVHLSPPSSPPWSMPGSPTMGRDSQLHGQAKARRRVWIPSRWELSFQAVWWGYRIYLPPPVMDTLGDNTLEAARRAALVTTALTWFFSNIPLPSLPPALQPAILLLQTLIPYIGYLGSFISWSWGTIQSYDTGHGVVLTATWLLPIALIPSTWEAEDFPPPSPFPSSTPLPNLHVSPLPSAIRSPTVPLPILPPLTPSTSTLNPEIPIQLHPGLDSPALSFVTAPNSPVQSSQRYHQSPGPIPSLPTFPNQWAWASPQANSSSPTLVPIPSLPTSPNQWAWASLQANSSSPALVPIPSLPTSPNQWAWASPQTNSSSSHSPTIYATPTMLSPLQLMSPYPISPSPLPQSRAYDPFQAWVLPPTPMPATIPLPEVDERDVNVTVTTGTPRMGIRGMGQAHLGRSEKSERSKRRSGEERRRVDADAEEANGTEQGGKRSSRIVQALGSPQRKGESSKSTAPGSRQ